MTRGCFCASSCASAFGRLPNRLPSSERLIDPPVSYAVALRAGTHGVKRSRVADAPALNDR